MQFTPHLTFPGQCEAAFKFYERFLGGKIMTMLTYGDSPMAAQISPEWHSKIVHASMTVGASRLVGADVLGEQYQPPQGFFVLLTTDEAAEAERAFRALAETGTVLMAAQNTFWSSYFGVLIDRFGIPWEISCEQKKDRHPVGYGSARSGSLEDDKRNF
ncbi:MAG: VOC family protein [Myxococcaceae bacterium]